MKRNILFSAMMVLAVIVGFTILGISTADAAKPAQVTSGDTTLDDLQTAYNGESNAHVRYLAFAKKAEAEGYLKVAALFRATARSEEIHAKNHADVIMKMKAEPIAKIETPKVGTTKQNLEASIKGEIYERGTMYPEFIKRAEANNNPAAVRTFTFAEKVETNHAALYKSALDNLNDWKVGGVKFSVCSECGNTVEKVDFLRCPVCHESKKKYSVVE